MLLSYYLLITYNKIVMDDLSQKAALVRKWSLIATTEAGSGHPTSCLSAADLVTVLFDRYYTYDLKNPRNISNDRLLFSKGHAAPLFYTLYALSGGFPIDELKTLRKFSSRLEGHPTPRFPFAEAATGSLGQGLSVGAGLAIGLQKEQRVEKKPKVYVLLGDGEMAEGQIWEAANFASYYKLENLIAIADVNGLGQSQATMFGHNVQEYEKRFASFGWSTIVIDGHNFEQITHAFDEADKTMRKPVAIIANTKKGKGVSFLEDKEGWHGKPLKNDDLEKALAELGELRDEIIFHLPLPQTTISSPSVQASDGNNTLSFQEGELVGTREVYGKALAELGKRNESIIALDGDVKNSTYSLDFQKAFHDRFIECFIAEQNMVSVAAGLSRLGKHPFVSTFAAFLTRSFDQIRMARLSNAAISFAGSHAGVSIGEDGASQMGLEDIAMFSVLPDTLIFQPSDALSAAKLLPHMASYDGISYLRTLRPKTPILYSSNDTFSIGGSKTLRSSQNDVLTVVASGITVHEALKAYEVLAKEQISIRVIDAYSIKPFDSKTLIKSLSETKKKVLITVEDHFEHGGLGDAVLSVLAEENITAPVKKLSVRHISHSGKGDELLSLAGIDADAIVKSVKYFI